MNWDLVWTVVALGVVTLFFIPFYIVLLLAYKKSMTKIELEFVSTANSINKKVQFEDAVERLFEDGEII